MKKKALVTVISVVVILLALSSSMSNPVAAEPETATKPVLAQVKKPRQSQPAQLKDSVTGQIIGYVDPKTKNLVFTRRNIMIPRSGIARVSKEEYELLKQHYGLAPAGTMKPRYAKPLPRVIPAPVNPSTHFLAPKEAPACESSCWYMSEGGAMCRGCCTDVGGGYCSCWEECTDTSSSGVLSR
jgi:hypothetical protein